MYDSDAQQVHWWVATSGNSIPNLKIILQTDQTRETGAEEGIRLGWTTANGKISRAYSVCMFSEDIDDNDARSLVLKPFIGVSSTDGYRRILVVGV